MKIRRHSPGAAPTHIPRDKPGTITGPGPRQIIEVREPVRPKQPEPEKQDVQEVEEEVCEPADPTDEGQPEEQPKSKRRKKGS